MGKFGEFVVIVLTRWDPIMSGVLAAVIIAAISHFYEIRNGTGTLPWYFYVVISSGFIFYACFQAWREKDRGLQEAHRQLDDRAQRREQRETLARFITTGIQLRKRHETLKLLPGTAAAKEWDTDICTYLHLTFGYDYAILFQRPIGPHEYDLNKRPSHISEENYPTYLFFNMRLARLEKLIEELKDRAHVPHETNSTTP